MNGEIENNENNSEMTYEKAIAKLEQIITKLESNNVSLDESIKLFDEGTKLTAFCSEKLKQAEQKITMLNKENNN